jgi:hypothetical protein
LQIVKFVAPHKIHYKVSYVFFSMTQQVAEPLRAMVMGAPLEDARHLAQRYDRMRQEAEAQVFSPSVS